ncbi:MAG: YaiO family outer membrane beta-barrel protein [Leadbetterella sp.]
MSKILKRIFLLFWCLIMHFSGLAQIGDPDEEFKKARELAFSGKKMESQDLLLKILEKYPNYADVRLFLGNVYGWDGKYDNARKQYQHLIGQNEKVKEYWIAIIKNEIYADESVKAMTYVFQGLNVFPGDPDITILKARVQNFQSKPFEALSTLRNYTKQYPKDTLVPKYLSTFKKDMALNNVAIGTGLDVFSETFDPMRFYYLQYGRATRKGSIIGRYNLQRRFGSYGSQFEIDAYPSLGKGAYAFVNLGYSQSSIFPSFRYGVQIYKSLPRAYEASLGVRYLKFNSPLYIYTGSLGKYFGNSFVYATPFIIPSREGVSRSLTLHYRKYGANKDQYFGIRVSGGISPEFNRFIDAVNSQNILNLKSQSVGFNYNFKVKNNYNLISTRFILEHTQNQNDGYIWIYSMAISYDFTY